MIKKSELLKELGWNDQLISHFMIDDLNFNENSETELKNEMFEVKSLTITYNADQVSNNFIGAFVANAKEK